MGRAISSADRYCEDTSPRTRTLSPARILPACTTSGGKPSAPEYSMRAPSRRNASTRSPIGRSCIRGAPESRYSPPASASAAASGRNAVPALPRRSSADLTGKLPPTPCTTAESSDCRSILTPRRASASSITRVSSESSRDSTRVSPSESAASRSTRLEMLFDPGIFTVPCTRAIGSRSRNFTAAGSLCILQPALARLARSGKQFVQRLGVAAPEHGAQLVEPRTVALELRKQSLAVGKTDIAPHFRVTGSDPGEIAKAPCRIRKKPLGVLVARDPVDERVGEHVRQMAYRREHRIVFLRLHLEDARAATLPARAHQRDRARLVVLQRRQHHLAPAVEFGERRSGAAFLRSGDRMAGHEARKRALELAPREFHDVLLRAPGIGHHRLYAKERRDRAHDRLHLPDRHREQ